MNTTDNINYQSRKDPAQLEREIDQQRVHVESLIQALESKLSPGELFDRVLGVSKDGGRQFASNLSHTVRANPLPALMTAAGMLWLYAQKDRPVDGIYVEYQDDDDTSLKDRAGERLGSAKNRAGGAAHKVSDATRRGAHRVSSGFSQMLDENPIALGAMGIAAGALIGALLPSTRVEDEHLGQIRDRVVDKTREKAREATQPPHASNGQGNDASPRLNA